MDRRAAHRRFPPARTAGNRIFDLLLLGLLLAGLVTGRATGQGLLQRGGDDPLVIESDDGLVWVRDEKKVFARGNAKAIRSGVELRGDVLTAFYREGEGADGAKSGQEVYRILAEGDVVITTRNERVFGDRGEYNVDAGTFVLVGDNLRIEFERGLITARDQLEYWENKQLFVARGNARVAREDRRLRADILTALLGTNKEGKQEIHQIDAWGNVHVSTPTEIVRSEKGVYNVRTGIVRMEDGVKITRGDTQLNGSKAMVDLNTGISELVGGERRVRGLFRPSGKKDE